MYQLLKFFKMPKERG